MDKAIIGGTGVYDIGQESYTQLVETKYGNVEVDIVNIDGEEIVFLARHGKDHSLPPHLINYRANMKALEILGIKYIYATVAVGSCNDNYAPGDVVVIKDFIDFTKQRPITFFEGGDESVRHTDMSQPYCNNLRDKFNEVAKSESLQIKGDAVYVCTEGPRFETAQEIKMYKVLGGDVVGMTNVPESVLAKELGICYSAIGIISNWCTGMAGDEPIHDDIQDIVAGKKDDITRTFLNVFSGDINQNNCNCDDAIIEL